MKHILPITALVVAMQVQPVFAQQDVTDPAIARIEEDGFTVSDVRRTWLGRIAITAKNDHSLREVVLNRTTGAVLSDQLFALPSSQSPTDMPATGMTPSSPSGTNGPGGMGGGGMGGSGGGGGGGGGGF